MVTTKVKVLDNLGQNIAKEVSLTSRPDDNASCGKQARLGVVDYYTANINQLGHYRLSNCACEIPYQALINYTENGEDAFIPSLDKCYDKKGEIKQSKECSVWEDYPEQYKKTKKRNNTLYHQLLKSKPD